MDSPEILKPHLRETDSHIKEAFRLRVPVRSLGTLRAAPMWDTFVVPELSFSDECDASIGQSTRDPSPFARPLSDRPAPEISK